MSTPRQLAQKMPAARIVGVLTIALTLTPLVGCSNTPLTAQQNHDPLHGIRVPPGTQPQPGKGPTPQAMEPGGVPSLPTSLSASNNATLATSSGQGPWARKLAIDDQGRPYTPGQLTSGSRDPNYLPPNPNPKVEPVPDINAPTKVTPAGNWQPPSPVAGGPSSDEMLFKHLQDRGILQQKQDTVPGGIRLTCYARSATGLRIYEATAADYPAAAQAILRQLDEAR